MKKDISSIHDIKILVDAFYIKVREDEKIGPIFRDLAGFDWEKHLPVMYGFFENMLFYTGAYIGNPMQLHKHINRIFPLTAAHFTKWIELFNDTVDELFTGKIAEQAKQRIKSIAAVMQLKIQNDTSSADKIF